MHIIDLGVFRTLLSLWFDSSNWKKEWYINTTLRKQLDCELKKIKPPDSTMRTPRGLEERRFFKANEIEELFLHYFPVLLKNKLPRKYYDHFLLITYAIEYLSKPIIKKEDIDHAEELVNLFLHDMADLYDKNKITYNAHVASHLCEYVRMYGSCGECTTYPFEDFNGFIKNIVHGTNYIDREVVITLKICNAYSILNHILKSNSSTNGQHKKILIKL